MKTKTLAIILLSVLSLSTMLHAEEISLPAITKPALLEEGTQTSLSAVQIAELLPWAKDSKMFLVDLLDSVQNLTIDDKIEKLTFGIKQVSVESAPKHSELFMRYVLNRALVLNNTLSEEMSATAVGSADVKLRTLVASINMSLRYYDQDMKTLAKTGIPNFEAFSGEYFNFLHELNKSVFDASAQYQIEKISLEWFAWDLYRDLNNTRHAPKIAKITNALAMLPKIKQTDAQYIKYIQQLKKVSLSMNVLTADVSTRPISTKPTTNGEYSAKSTGSYYYSAKYRSCYRVSKSGEVMYNDSVGNSNCAKNSTYHYSNKYLACFKVSEAGDVMYNDSVDNSNCAKHSTYHYSNKYLTCFKVSEAGDVMYNDSVDNSNCAKHSTYHYSAKYQACFKVSKAGDVMYNDSVDNSYCK